MEINTARIESAKIIAEIISTSNKDVALQFGISQGNNPKHPSFYNEERVLSDFERGEKYYLCSVDGKYAGCVAYEQPSDKKAYLNRLAVLPSFRNQGVGECLTQFIVAHAESNNVSTISIGIIAEHKVLKDWYAKLGFVENGIKQFPHLPFDVLFMRYEVFG